MTHFKTANRSFCAAIGYAKRSGFNGISPWTHDVFETLVKGIPARRKNCLYARSSGIRYTSYPFDNGSATRKKTRQPAAPASLSNTAGPIGFIKPWSLRGAGKYNSEGAFHGTTSNSSSIEVFHASLRFILKNREHERRGKQYYMLRDSYLERNSCHMFLQLQ